MQIDLHGRVAIVTGAAHGFGRAITLALGRCGAVVWALDRLADELAETAELAAAAGMRCVPEACDITDSTAVTALIGRLSAAEGRIDILVNNAGGVCGQVHHPVETISDEDWDVVVRTNLYGTFYCTRAVAAAMKAQGSGRIVNISSGAGRSFSLTGIQSYASAKAGQIGLTRQMARELGPWGITVNNIAPGFVRSNPTTERQWEAMGAEGQQALLSRIALQRLGSADDIANGVLYFVSDLANWVTGQTISIDGGSHMT
ncbi:MAG: SDR family oxidoreductase [Oscillochloris sp.]|nr:SDR family oxidoreductase [Oscillochloris sp.]